MKKIVAILALLGLMGCSAGTAQKVAKTMRGLTGGDVPRSAFLDPTVKEALEHEMRVCLDGKLDDAELRAECAQIAVAKVKQQKGLDKEIDLGGEVIVREVADDEIIDRSDADQKSGDEDQ